MPYDQAPSKEIDMPDAAVTTKGQITIPVDIRRALRLREGDRVVFTTLPDGTVVMRAKTRSAADLAGILPRPSRRVPTSALRFGRRS
jgi:AbrB family looped-hinge helix DNA binding protein